jgi:hypothetical protein
VAVIALAGATGNIRLFQLLVQLGGNRPVALRPIIGTSSTFLPAEKNFFVAHWSDCLRTPEKAGGPAK